MPSPTQYLFFWLLPVVAAILLTNAVYAWRRPSTPGARSFAAACVMLAVWITSDIFTRFWHPSPNVIIFEYTKYLGVLSAPVLLVIFALQYRGKAVSRNLAVALFAIPAISALLILTNDLHHLFWSDIQFQYGETPRTKFGIYFWLIHMPYSYGCMTVSIFSFAREVLASSRFHRAQAFVLVMMTAVPFVMNIAYFTGLTGGKSYTSVSLVFFTMAVSWGLFKHSLLRSNPIAYETVFQTIHDSVVVLTPDNVVTDINPVGASYLGMEPEQVIGKNVKDILSDDPDLCGHFEKMIAEDTRKSIYESRYRRFFEITISPLHNQGGALIGRVAVARNITSHMKRSQMLESYAFRDSLTQIANRHLFEIEAERAMKEASVNNGSLAFVYFDLNRFKQINDTYGHEVGDQLLKYVSYRVGARLHNPDMLARLGGDEFILLLYGADEARVNEQMLSIFREMERPFEIKEHSFEVKISAGAALFPAHGSSLADLMSHADSAMYRAKANGGGLEFYAPIFLLPTEAMQQDRISMA